MTRQDEDVVRDLHQSYRGLGWSVVEFGWGGIRSVGLDTNSSRSPDCFRTKIRHTWVVVRLKRGDVFGPLILTSSSGKGSFINHPPVSAITDQGPNGFRLSGRLDYTTPYIERRRVQVQVQNPPTPTCQ